jgi:hypothetical protein
MRIAIACLAALLAAAAAGSAAANDGVAARGLGGVELSQTSAIEMVREDLTISADEITVRYEYRNRVDAEVITLVAFPLPPVSTDDRFAFVLPVEGSANYVGFRLWVDGREIEPQVQTRAMVMDVDVTPLLRELGIPLVPPKVDDNDTLSALPEPAWRRLAESGAVSAHEATRSLEALWSIETLFYWTQRFPALGRVIVEHTYQPIRGGRWIYPDDLDGVDSARWRKRYCVEGATVEALRERHASRADTIAELNGQTVDYVLKTARTWAGPIGTFHLTVDTRRPDALVSVCPADLGLTQTGPTTFETTLRDWLPPDDLRILFVAPPSD